MPDTKIPTTSVVKDSDLGKQILDKLIGTNWDTFGAPEGSDSTSLLLQEIISSFNMVALTGVSILFCLTIASSVLSTAHEGVPFGKRYSSVWMPLRFGLTLGALAPIFKGYSFFQIFMLAVFGWSMNFGNFIYISGQNHFAKHGGTLVVDAPETIPNNFREILDEMVVASTIQQFYANYKNNPKYGNGLPQWSGFINDPPSNGIIPKTGQFEYRYAGGLGGVTIRAVGSKDALAEAKKQAFSTAMNSTILPISKLLANPKTDPSALHGEHLQDAYKKYTAEVLKNIQAHIKKSGESSTLKAKLEKMQASASKYGWLSAGASYWSISWMNQEVRDNYYADMETSSFNFKMRAIWDNLTSSEFRAVKARVENFSKYAYGTQKEGINEILAHPTLEEPKDSGKVMMSLRKAVNKGSAWILEGIFTTLQGGKTDIVACLANVGDYLIGMSYTILGSLGALSFIASNSSILMGYFSACIPLFVGGATLAFYLPAIPFIRFMAGVGAWFILLFESLLAGTLWLCGHALPDGDGLAGNHGKQGYFLFLGILFRPPLMIAGFFIALMLLNSLGSFIGIVFMEFAGSMMQMTTVGIVGTFSMLFILGSVVILLANQLFGLIEFLPQHLTNWIGQQIHNLGEKEDISKASTGLAGATSAGIGAFAGARGANPKLKPNKPPKNGRNADNTITGGEERHQ